MATYSNLRGDLDAGSTVLSRLNALARRRGEVWLVTSGGRTLSQQAGVRSTYGPKAAATPNAPHVSGRAADVTVNGRPIWQAVPADQLRRAGLTTFGGGQRSDPVHVEAAGVKQDRGGPGIGTLAKAAIPIVGPALAGADLLNVPGPQDLAGAAAKKVVGEGVDLIKGDGARALLWLVLVGGGAAFVVLGLMRTAGLKPTELASTAVSLAPQGRAMKAAGAARGAGKATGAARAGKVS